MHKPGTNEGLIIKYVVDKYNLIPVNPMSTSSGAVNTNVYSIHIICFKLFLHINYKPFYYINYHYT